MSSTDTLPGFVGNSRMLNFKQLRAMLALNDRYLWSLIHCEKSDLRIPSYKIGRRRMFKFDEILWWLENRKS